MQKVGSWNKTSNKTTQFTKFPLSPLLVLSLYHISLFVAFSFTSFESDMENVMCALCIKGAILHDFTDNPHTTFSLRSRRFKADYGRATKLRSLAPFLQLLTLPILGTILLSFHHGPSTKQFLFVCDDFLILSISSFGSALKRACWRVFERRQMGRLKILHFKSHSRLNEKSFVLFIQ